MPELIPDTTTEWVLAWLVIIVLALWALAEIISRTDWIFEDPQTGTYDIPDLPAEDREAAWDEAASDPAIDDLGDEPIDDLDDSEGGADDDDMNIGDLPDLS